ncbi:hypothetical protein NIES4072_03900 [Nostoc commune NIES-4072]|uniref:Uncharacterized protein n=2 Tax=Nostoc commune TaxID=1178 RepID=A0A2R5FM83_NOSCO|nr:hypothetical protein NIES4070_22920 [Nostoc commune HK-02]GBG16744.1 hypothetical protein NIES4072_03900 [Nostoc commune NIES-4072]
MTMFKLSDIIRLLSGFFNVSEQKQVAYRMFMSESLRAKFKSLCALKQLSMNEVLVELVENWIKESESKSDRDKGAA